MTDFTADQILDIMVDTIDHERAVKREILAGNLDPRSKDRFMLSALNGQQLEDVIAMILSFKSNRLNPNPGA